MDDLELYKFQLSDIQGSLDLDPENEELLKLKKDIEEAIQLLEELTQEPVQIPRKKLRQETVSAIEVPSPPPEAPPAQPVAENEVWAIGDVCFVLVDEDNGEKYVDANIIGISADRSLFTIRLLSSNQIKVLHKDLLFKKKPSVVIQRKVSESSTLNKKELADVVPPAKVKSKKSKSSLTYREFLHKKEAEQSQKANAWKSFMQKKVNK